MRMIRLANTQLLRHLLTSLLVCAFCVSSHTVIAQDKPPSIDELASKLPRIPASTPEQSVDKMQIHPAFEVQIVATEPLIRDPAAIDIDENGRMYVCELPEYNAYAVADNPHEKGTVKRLVDTNGDGRYDKATLFVKDIAYPTAIICWDDGVFIGSAPDLFYCKDTTGDGIADIHHKILTGFGSDLAGEAHLNSFRWGVDNRIHISTNLSGGNVRLANAAESTAVSTRGRGIILNPRDLSGFELTSGAGQHGMSMDNWGRKFVCSNSVPAQMLMLDDRYLARNPYLTAPNLAVDIAPDGKHTELFRISAAEPWRELRTMLRRTKQFRGSDEGGKPFGFFTGATGITIYRGNAWPAEFHGNLIVGDVANNLIYRAILKPKGLELVAEKADVGKEFIASRDLWFRPVQFTNAPDGTLYAIDISRELIEGAAFLPPEFMKYLDPLSGSKQGRIYRIAPRGFSTPATPNLGELATRELVSLLDHTNGWHRDTASRLIYQRQDSSAITSLRQLVKQGETAAGRFTALYTLQGLGALDESSVLAALIDSDAIVRVHALRVAEALVAQSVAISNRFSNMTTDRDIQVRYQLAFSLGAAQGKNRYQALTRLALSDHQDKWMPVAISSSLFQGAGFVFRELTTHDTFLKTTTGQQFMLTLATQIGARQRADELAAVLQSLSSIKNHDATLAPKVMEALVKNIEGEQRTKLLASTGENAAMVLQQLIVESMDIAQSPQESTEKRAAAIRSLQLAKFADIKSIMVDLLDLTEPFGVRAAVIETLGSYTDDQAAEMLIANWRSLGPSLRSRAAETLLSRANWVTLLLNAVQTERIARGEIDPARIQLLKAHPDKNIAQRVADIFMSSPNGDRFDVIKEYQSALDTLGDVGKGKEVFKKVCSACHRLENIGTSVGADLNGIRNRGLPAVLLNILDPNREVKPKYLTYVLIDVKGRATTGMITSENANSITLQKPDGTNTTILRTEIEVLQSTGLSFMPEGLEKQVSKQQMADLLSYLNALQ
ncbi:MAG: c-type cytochrome [Planctomycetaceae bacterium]|nr:c-type cytochrome [Planctomycetaceae bacterium]